MVTGTNSKMLTARQRRLLLLIGVFVFVMMNMIFSYAWADSASDAPDPFNPLIGEKCTITYTVSSEFQPMLEIYKGSTLIYNPVFPALMMDPGTYTIDWDGRDSTGKLVPDGTYTYFVAGGGGTVTVQTGPRIAAFSSVSVNPSVFDPLNPAGNNAVISYNISQSASVTAQILKGSTVVRTIVSGQAQSAGAHSAAWDGRDTLGNYPADGVYSFKIIAVNLVGVTSSTSASIALEKDTPNVSGLTVSPNPLKLSSGSLTVRYTLSEPAKVTVNIIDSSGNTVRTLLNGVTQNAGALSTTWDGKDSSGVYVPGGTYSVKVGAVDNYGKAAVEQTAPFTADYLPVLSSVSVSPTLYDPLNPPDNKAIISYTTSKDAKVTVQVLKGSTVVRTLVNGLIQTAGPNSAEWNGKDDAGSYLADAAYSFKITAVNPVVSSFYSTATGSITIEKAAPSITGLKVSPNPLKLSAGSLTVSYTLSEAAKINLDVVNSSGETVRTILSGSAKSAGANSSTWDGKDTSGSYVPGGTYSVVISAVDNYNKSSEVQTMSFVAEYLPVVSSGSINPAVFDPLNPSDNSAIISYTISKDAKVTVQVLKGSTVVRTIVNGVTQSAGVNSVQWDGKDVAGIYLADAIYSFKITAINPVVSSFYSTATGSITIEKAAPSITGLKVSPNPLKLSAGSLTVSYTLSEAANATLTIVDGSGETVRTVLNGAAKAAGATSAAWDGKDSTGSYVPGGTYSVVISAVDNYGKGSGIQTMSFVAEYQPVISGVSVNPTVFDPLNPPDNKAVISYTISKDAKVTVQVLKGSTVVKTLVNSVIQSAGVNSIQWDGKDDIDSYLADAIYSFKITAVNPSVSSFYSTAAGSITIEKGAPSITGLTVSPNPLKLSAGSLTISYTLSEAAKVNLDVVNGSGQTVRTILNGLTKNAGANSSTWDGKDAAGSYVPGGTYLAVLSAVDNYGKVSGSLTVSFVAEYQPVLSSISASPSTFNPGAQSTVISYTVSKDAKVTVQILKSTTVVRTLVNSQLQAAGASSVQWDGRNDAGTTVGDGSYSFKITAVNPVVSTFSTISSGTVVVEQAAPSVTALTVSTNPYKIGGSLVTSYTLSENAAVYVDILQDTTVIRTMASGLAKSSGANSASWDGKDSSGRLVAEGTYSVRVKAVDPSGKSGEAAVSFVAVYQPTLTAVSAAPFPFNPAGGDASINFTLSCPANVTVTILKGSLQVRKYSPGVLAAGPNTQAWDGQDELGQLVSDSLYTYQIDAASPTLANTKTTFKGSITVDASNPAVTGISVTPSPVKLGQNATFTYTLSETATMTVEIVDSSGTVVRQYTGLYKSTGGTYTLIWDTKDSSGRVVPAGSYKARFTAVDKFNKTGSLEFSFTAQAVYYPL